MLGVKTLPGWLDCQLLLVSVPCFITSLCPWKQEKIDVEWFVCTQKSLCAHMCWSNVYANCGGLPQNYILDLWMEFGLFCWIKYQKSKILFLLFSNSTTGIEEYMLAQSSIPSFWEYSWKIWNEVSHHSIIYSLE